MLTFSQPRSLSLTFPLSLSLSRARSLVCFGKRALAFYAHISSLSLFLSISLTRISSLSLSPVFGKRALPPPVTFELCQNELRCMQVIGKRKETWLFLFRSHAHHTVEKCPHPSFRTTTRLSLYTSPTLTCIEFDVITYI